MVTQELIKQVSIPDPENKDLKFNKSKYLEIQKTEKIPCPFCGNTLQTRKRKDDPSKHNYRCQSKPCENYRKLHDFKLSDFL